MPALIRSPSESAERAATLIQHWRAGRMPVYLMGRNAFTSTVLAFATRDSLPVAGLIASDVEANSWQGLTVCRLSDAPPDALVVNCVADGRTITLQKQIRRANAIPLTYFELSAWSAQDFPLSFLAPPFSSEDEAGLRWVMGRLDDEYSRITLAKVLEFRSSLNVEPLSMFPFDVANQYVESFVRSQGYAHFVDGGVFDGRNTRTLLEAYPTLQSATLLEPNRAMHPTIRETLLGRSYELLGQGLWHTAGQLRFNANSGPASGIDDNGTDVIDVIRIDDLALPDGSWIKLDLEGAEVAALQGARTTILERRPGLAIATYHDNRHFYQIPQFVLGLRPDYRMKIRHYTEGRLETIYYFL